MSLKHTILGFLNNSPKTGYDLQKKIKITISHFWPSTQSQIYRTLNEMSDDKLISSKLEYQDEKPNKKIYSITDKGYEELLNWLKSPLNIPAHRNQFLVQLFFSKNIDKDYVIANLNHYKDELEKKLKFLKSKEVTGMVKMTDKDIEKVLFDVILNNGLKVLECEIGWAEESIDKIKKS